MVAPALKYKSNWTESYILVNHLSKPFIWESLRNLIFSRPIDHSWKLQKALLSCTATAFSISLEIYLRFETGRKFAKTLWSAVGFFNNGRSMAHFKSSGISPVPNDKLMILVSIGNKAWQHLAMIEAGSGSSEHDLIAPDLINLKTSLFVRDLKDCSFVSQLKHCSVSDIVVNSGTLRPTAIS